MNAKAVSGVGILVAMFACGGTSSPSGNQGPDGGGTNFTLTINVSGAGSVTSPDGSINCATSACTQSVASGAAVHLVANPAAGTQFTGWTGACSGTGTCDLTMSADATVGATFSVMISVELDGAGGGHVTSSPAGIDCTKVASNNLADVGTGACSMVVANGTAVTLTATADATSNFMGYGGSVCHGTSCTLTASAAAKIFVDFESKTPSTVQHTLTVNVTGSGTVASQPAAIACPGTCAAPFAQGSAVVLVATPAAGATFTGWTGACTGTADCSVTMAADATVGATFSTAANSCAGLVPALTNPTSYTVVPTMAGTPLCKNPVGDGLGNIYVEALAAGIDPDGEAIFNGTTPVVTNVEVSEALRSGFTTLGFSGTAGTATATTHYNVSNPDGSPGTDTPIPGAFALVGQAVNGGTVVATEECSGSTPAGTPVAFHLARFDDAGAVVGTPATFTETACPLLSGGVLVDANDDTLLAYDTGTAGAFGIDPQRVAARWFDGAGVALSAWFDAGPSGTGGFSALIGGGVAVRFNGAWTSVITSGKAELKPAPAFLEAGKRPVIVEGGKAYAMIPDSAPGMPDIVAADGTSCGPLTTSTFTAADLYAVGKDGTLVDLQGAGNCSVTAFPQALK